MWGKAMHRVSSADKKEHVSIPGFKQFFTLSPLPVFFFQHNSIHVFVPCSIERYSLISFQRTFHGVNG